MTKSAAAVPPSRSSARDKIIVALDVGSADAARRLVDQLAGEAGAFKVGLQLYTAAGPDFIRELTRRGIRVFLDLKFHDIPNTVVEASLAAARLGVWMFNVHAAGGSEMMRSAAGAVAELCERQAMTRPLIIGVTVLTSSDQTVLDEIGVTLPVRDQVQRLAALAAESGLDGVVASAHEALALKHAVKTANLCIVTPGIRNASGTRDDQRRVTTIRDAIANGSDYVVIGRPITRATDPVSAIREMIAELDLSQG